MKLIVTKSSLPFIAKQYRPLARGTVAIVPPDSGDQLEFCQIYGWAKGVRNR